MDRTNAERQRRYIQRLKAQATGGVSNAPGEAATLRQELAAAKAELARERERRKAAEAKIESFDGRGKAKGEPIIDPATLSMTAQQKLATAVRQEMRRLGAEFHKLVNEKANQHVNEYWLPEHKKKIADAERVLNRRAGIMTPQAFNLIRSSLHPDSRLSISDKKLADAFRAFMALEKMLLSEKDSPSKTPGLPERWEDWEKMRRRPKARGKTKGGTNSPMV